MAVEDGVLGRPAARCSPHRGSLSLAISAGIAIHGAVDPNEIQIMLQSRSSARSPSRTADFPATRARYETNERLQVTRPALTGSALEPNRIDAGQYAESSGFARNIRS